MVKNFSKCLHCFFKMYNWLHFVSFGVLRAFRSNISLQFCSLLDGSFKICRYLCDKRSICMMFNCGIQTPTKKRGHHQVLKTDETFLLLFGTLSLLNSYFDGMRNAFSFSFIRNGKEF